MSPIDRLKEYLHAYSSKDLNAISCMLSDSVTLQDWNVSVQGKSAVIDETQRNFQAASTIGIHIKSAYEHAHSAIAELGILVDGNVALEVVDVLVFDELGQVLAIRSYKG